MFHDSNTNNYKLMGGISSNASIYPENNDTFTQDKNILIHSKEK